MHFPVGSARSFWKSRFCKPNHYPKEFKIMCKPLIIPISKHSCIAELEVLELSDSPMFTNQTQKWASRLQVNFRLEDDNYGYSHHYIINSALCSVSAFRRCLTTVLSRLEPLACQRYDFGSMDRQVPFERVVIVIDHFYWRLKTCFHLTKVLIKHKIYSSDDQPGSWRFTVSRLGSFPDTIACGSLDLQEQGCPSSLTYKF